MAKFVRVGNFHVYIVKCSDGSYYTGYSPDLKRRIALHNAGRGAKYTRARRPVKLVWSRKFRYFKTAFKTEIAVKKLNRAQKVKLIKGLFKGHIT